MLKCDFCVASKEECSQCKDNPIYADYPKISKFMAYKPTCPRGYNDCVSDPAYIKFYHPKWYKKMYGNLSPEVVAEECRKRVEEDPDEEFYCYDDEDK